MSTECEGVEIYCALYSPFSAILLQGMQRILVAGGGPGERWHFGMASVSQYTRGLFIAMEFCLGCN